MKSILTLTDFSTIADDAVEAAFQLAQLYNADLHIFHSFTNNEQIDLTFGEQLEIEFTNSAEDNIKEKIEHWNEWSQKLEVYTKFHFVSSDFIEHLEVMVSKLNPDLIIMGSKGVSDRNESIWGSNTQKIVKAIDRPILVIKEPMQDYHLDNIVFASSFDESEQQGFEYFLKLINPPKEAIIHLVCVDTLGYFSEPSTAIKESMGKFSDLAAPYQTKSYFYKDYSIDAGIRHIMEELGPDMLVMTNKDHKPLKYLLQGNNVLKLAQNSDFPVLIIDYAD